MSIWFGSSINNFMTANSMDFSSCFLPQCLKLQQPNPKTWHGLAQMGYQELFAYCDNINAAMERSRHGLEAA
jgi:hypothetical protein